MCCLWDTSNKIYGNMNFIKNNFLQISKEKYVKPIDYFINTTFETTDTQFIEGDFLIKFENKKLLKIIINARLNGVLFDNLDFKIYSYDKHSDSIEINFGKENSKKQYDGTQIFTIDVSKIECYKVVEVIIIRGMNYITINNLTLQYEESFLSIDYKSFKSAISNFIK